MNRCTKIVRRPPPLWVLLDLLMLWVLVLLSQPMQKQGVTYRFLGLPPGSVLFEVRGTVHGDERVWIYFDFDTQRWVEGTKITPHGRENFLCNECGDFLPGAVRRPGAIMVGIPQAVQARVRDRFFEACLAGDCAPTVYIDGEGGVSLQAKEAG